MGDSEPKREGPPTLTGRQAALADIAERRRKDPNWNPGNDPTYSGPHPAFLQMMSETEFEHYMAGKVARGQLRDNPYAPQTVERTESQPVPPSVHCAAIPFGQRVRDLRLALGWTQREAGEHLGVSTRSIIRYEQGRSSPIRSVTLLAFRRLESTHIRELDAGVPASVTHAPRSVPFR